MAYRRRRWPNYALQALEDVKALLLEIERDSRAAQVAAQDGNRLEVIILASDMRKAAQDAGTILTRARNGDYE